MSAITRFPAVIFDFDGTLIDSAPDIAKALNHVLAAAGRPVLPLDDVKMMIGDGAPVLVERGFAATGPALTGVALVTQQQQFMAIYADLPADPGCLYPGVIETLIALKAAGHRLGLCTNKPIAITRDLLPLLEMDRLFDAVVGGDTLAQRKPHPAPLLWAMERLGVGADAAVMVGDNANDVATARGAGIPVVAVSYGYPRMPVADLGADIIIDRFADLTEALTHLS